MRRILVVYGLAMTSVVLIAFLVPLGLLARSLAHDRALTAARQDNQTVAVFASGATQDMARLEAALLDVGGSERSTTVYLPDGTTMGALAPESPAVALAQSGLSLTADAEGGVEVLLPVGGADGITVVRTFVPDSALERGVWQSWLILIGVGGLLLAGTALAGDRVAVRLTRSVHDLAETADRLGAGDLDARVEPSGPPEVASVGRVLNGLGARVAALLAAERELVSDLSHRLRTPITALRLDAEALAEPQERKRMTGHVEDLVGAVDALVIGLREPRRRDESTESCDAAAVVRERAAFWSVLAVDQGRDLALDMPPGPAAVPVSAVTLGAALDALVDNVLTHTPDGSGFVLSVTLGNGVVGVGVEDSGPGIASEALAERGRSGAGSTGIGLDVARRTAEDAGGRLVLRSGATGGAVVLLELPLVG